MLYSQAGREKALRQRAWDDGHMNQEAVFAQKVSTATVGNIASLGEPGGQDQSIKCLMHTLSFLSCLSEY